MINDFVCILVLDLIFKLSSLQLKFESAHEKWLVVFSVILFWI